MKFAIKSLTSVSLCVGLSVISITASAVGTGNTFGVDESKVPGSMANLFQSNSIDFTYHACTNTSQTPAGDVLLEKGYFWVSSYQDANSVVDSQINFFNNPGYHIYGIYEFSADNVGAEITALGERRDYNIRTAKISLFLDPLSDTNIDLPGCVITIANTTDDRRIGFANGVLVGEKSEKVDLANGDFELQFHNWTWVNPAPFVPFSPTPFMSFNANLTQLGGSLAGKHKPEGSGNIFWWE